MKLSKSRNEGDRSIHFLYSDRQLIKQRGLSIQRGQRSFERDSWIPIGQR